MKSYLKRLEEALKGSKSERELELLEYSIKNLKRYLIKTESSERREIMTMLDRTKKERKLYLSTLEI